MSLSVAVFKRGKFPFDVMQNIMKTSRPALMRQTEILCENDYLNAIAVIVGTCDDEPVAMTTIEKGKWNDYNGLWMHDFCRKHGTTFDMNILLNEAVKIKRRLHKHLYLFVDEERPRMVQYYSDKNFSIKKRNVRLAREDERYVIMRHD
jgi:hypothetical protein